MKRHVQEPGVRKWSGNDLLDLQGEGLAIADSFFSQYGDCVICGCQVTDNSIAAGLVSIGGMVLPLAAVDAVEVFPVYLVKAEEHIQREYADDVVRDIAVKHYAKPVQAKPEGGGYIEVTGEGTATFFDKLQATWLADILKKLTELKGTDKDLAEAIALLKETSTTDGKRIAALEKQMPSFLDHTPTITDDGYPIGKEVWTVDASGNKTFWKCHDNAEGAAIWRESGEGGGGGSHSGAVYLAGQTDIASAGILIKEGYLS